MQLLCCDIWTPIARSTTQQGRAAEQTLVAHRQQAGTAAENWFNTGPNINLPIGEDSVSYGRRLLAYNAHFLCRTLYRPPVG